MTHLVHYPIYIFLNVCLQVNVRYAVVNRGPSELFSSLGVRRRPLTFRKIFSSETTGPNETKLSLNHPYSGI